jgi:hypothetical protein
MKKQIIITAITLLILSSASTAFCKKKPSYTIEPDAMISSDVKNRMDVIDALVKVVKAHGNTCDSVSAVSVNMFSHGFTLKCNKFRYVYEILDKGGKWYLEVK